MFNNIFILKMKKIKLLFTFLAIGVLVSACDLSPEEIEPLTNPTYYDEKTGQSGGNPPPQPPPD